MTQVSWSPVVDAPRQDVAVELRDANLLEGLGELRHAVRRTLLSGGSRVVVDISGIERLSSATVAALLWANRHCSPRGGTVVLRGPSDESLELLRRTGLADVLEVWPAWSAGGRS